jgi:hypothetical protein
MSSGAFRSACLGLGPASTAMPAAFHLATDASKFLTRNPKWLITDPTVAQVESCFRKRIRAGGPSKALGIPCATSATRIHKSLDVRAA